jgi:hypothetical protein
MGFAIYVVPEREIPGFDCFVPGKPLGQVGPDESQAWAEAAGVRPLSEFCSVSSADLSDLLGEEEAEEFDDLPPEQWFSAAEGLQTVRGLRQYLEAHPEIAAPWRFSREGVLMDLNEFERVLIRLDQEQIGWRLGFDV